MPESVPELELPSGERIRLDRTVVLGRSNESDVVVADPEASRRHAQIRFEGAVYLIADMQSRNGTAVNAEPLLEPRPLRDGDEIQIGKTSLIFRAPTPAAPPAGSAAPPLVDPTMQMQAVPRSPMQVLGRISRQITGIVDAKALADAVTEAIREEYGCEGASLILVDHDRDELYFASVASPEATGLKLMTLKRGHGIAGEVIEAQRAVVVSDVSAAKNHAGELDRALGFSSRSIVAAPVFGPEGEVLGALEAVNPLRKPAFDDDDLEFISLVAGQLGVALTNARSWDAIERERTALSRVAGIRRDFVAVSPATIRLVVDVADLHAARTPIYLVGEAGAGKRMLARLTQEASGDAGDVRELNGATAPLPDDLAELLRSATIHVTHLEEIGIAGQELLAAAITEAAGSRAIYVSGSVSLLSLLSERKLAGSLHTALEAGQRIIPPLRARTDEIDTMVEQFAANVSARLRRDRFTFSPDALVLLREYSWPGNVAQLDALIRKVGVLARESVVPLELLEALAPELHTSSDSGDASRFSRGPLARKAASRVALAEEQLESGDTSQRLEAVASLSETSGEPAATMLGNFLEAPEPAVRAQAAIALRGRGSALDAVAARLEVEDEAAVAVALIETLELSGQAAEFEVVRRAVQAGDGGVRRQAIRALRKAQAEDTLELATSAASDADPRVRAEALALRFQLGIEGSGDNLLAMTGDSNLEAAAAAIELCGELNFGAEHLAEASVSGDQLIRVAAVRALGATRDSQWAPGLLRLLDDPALRVEAIGALGLLKASEAEARLSEFAAETRLPVAVRRTSLRALASIAGAVATPALVAAVHDAEVTDAAADGLLALADPASERALLEHVAADPSRAATVGRVLAVCGSGESIRPLLRAAGRAPQHEFVVLGSLVAICGRLADRQPLFAEIGEALQEEDARLLGLQLLGELNDPAGTPLLLRYRDWSQEARIGLSRLGAAALPQLLLALQGEHRDAAEETLAEMGPEIVPELLPLLTEPGLSRAAARVIQAAGESALPALLDAAEVGDSASLPLILQLIGRIHNARLASYVTTFLDSPDEATRYAAIVALGDLPDAQGEAALLSVLESGEPIPAALATLALGRTRSARAFETLLGRVSHPDRKLQYANAAAMGNFNLRQPPVLALIKRSVRGGLPFSSSAMEAGFRGGVLETADIAEVLANNEVSRSQKLRVIGVLGRMPADIATPTLGELLKITELAEDLRGPLVAAFVRHEATVSAEVTALLKDPATRDQGVVILEAMQDPHALIAVLRAIAPSLETDEQLRRALRAKGDQLLGPLLDVLYENWELPALALLWQLSEVVTEDTARRAAVL